MVDWFWNLFLSREETVSKAFICHKDTTARRKVRLKIKALFFSALVASVLRLTFEAAFLYKSSQYL
jgi:hypothetical protein